MLYYRLFSFLVVFLLSFLLSFLFWKDQLIYWIIILSAALAFSGVWLLVKPKLKNLKEKFFFSLWGALIVGASIFLFIFIESLAIRILLAVTAAGTYLYLLNELFNQYFKRTIIQLDKLYSFFRAINIYIVFAVAAGSYGLISFLNVKVYWLILPFLLLILILSRYQQFQLWDLKIKPIYLGLIKAVLVTEIFITLSFLSQLYYIKGILLTIFYFLLSEIIIWFYQSERRKKVVWTYIIFSLFLTLLILLSSTWY